jgi:hypothetical protein
MSLFFIALFLPFLGTPAAPDLEKDLYAALARHGRASVPELNLILLTEAVEGRTLVNFIALRKDASGRVQGVLEAPKAELRVNSMKPSLVLHLCQPTGFSRRGEPFALSDTDVELFLPAKARK